MGKTQEIQFSKGFIFPKIEYSKKQHKNHITPISNISKSLRKFGPNTGTLFDQLLFIFEPKGSIIIP